MRWTLHVSLAISLMLQTALGALHTKKPLAVTKYGTLQGKEMHVGKTPIHVFLGVPFSRPPVGVRRFAPPEPLEPWKGIRNATTYPPACLQEPRGQIASIYFNTRKPYQWLRFSEDCLYLNVYAPARARGDPLMPVMVWFPGGAFLVGSASTYDGSELAAREKVVLVSLQHRLGILGFLSTGDSQARGNWALLDQVAALRWVQENIMAFGGDPGSVTLFGQSSGAMCISGLMMSPLAQGLFHRAISQSGTAVLKIFITPDPLKVAKKVAHLAGCNHNSTQILVKCLRALSGAKVIHVSKKMVSKAFQLPDLAACWPPSYPGTQPSPATSPETLSQEHIGETSCTSDPLLSSTEILPSAPELPGRPKRGLQATFCNSILNTWIIWFVSPVVDGVVFPDDPVVLLTQGQVSPVPYLLGVNNMEFNWLLPYVMNFPLNQCAMKTEVITRILWSTSTLLNITKEQVPLVMEEYLGDIDECDWKMLRNRVIDLCGDATFVYSTLQTGRYHREIPMVRSYPAGHATIRMKSTCSWMLTQAWV
ncbi:carboxylesterase 4A [Microcebus murinus]|uniref:carboxylesterase 4A n=1 Tax=Microcebus murinus TaxID=30608 RepID=UPI003F6B9031